MAMPVDQALYATERNFSHHLCSRNNRVIKKVEQALQDIENGDYGICDRCNEDYTQTVIGSTKRDYVWVMARKPYIPDDDYNRILDFIKSQGYDLSKLQKVPQQVS
jgi:lipocalin